MLCSLNGGLTDSKEDLHAFRSTIGWLLQKSKQYGMLIMACSISIAHFKSWTSWTRLFPRRLRWTHVRLPTTKLTNQLIYHLWQTYPQKHPRSLTKLLTNWIATPVFLRAALSVLWKSAGRGLPTHLETMNLAEIRRQRYLSKEHKNLFEEAKKKDRGSYFCFKILGPKEPQATYVVAYSVGFQLSRQLLEVLCTWASVDRSKWPRKVFSYLFLDFVKFTRWVVLQNMITPANCKSCMMLSQAWGHGYLADPPSRNVMWRYGFNTEVNYNDNELYCGGFISECLPSNLN